MAKVLVTGAAGFIGFHTVIRLVQDGHIVIGLDSINEYYDVELKYNRLRASGIEIESIAWGKIVISSKYELYSFVRQDIVDSSMIISLFKSSNFDFVIHLAAQAGVRYSLTNPQVYLDCNIKGFLNILEACRQSPVNHLIYASSSSVYGSNTKTPYSEHDNVDHPVSLYAATKKANELMAHTYSHLFKIPTTGLRFFTVYGPWGRPDMALFAFTKSIIEGKPISVFNNGNMARDFTYIDDIVEGIIRIMDLPAKSNVEYRNDQPDPAISLAPFTIFNIGNSKPVKLIDFIEYIEQNLGIKAIRQMMPLQAGDVLETSSDTSRLFEAINYKPIIEVKKGVEMFINWYKEYYNIKM